MRQDIEGLVVELDVQEVAPLASVSRVLSIAAWTTLIATTLYLLSRKQKQTT